MRPCGSSAAKPRPWITRHRTREGQFFFPDLVHRIWRPTTFAAPVPPVKLCKGRKSSAAPSSSGGDEAVPPYDAWPPTFNSRTETKRRSDGGLLSLGTGLRAYGWVGERDLVQRAISPNIRRDTARARTL